MEVMVKVGGLKQLGECLQAMGDDMVLRTARRMANAGAQVVKEIAIYNAPSSKKAHWLGKKKGGQLVQPGNLKDNIVVVRLKPTKLGREDYTVGVRHGSGVAGKDAFYWMFLEFGTVNMQKRPFLRPAFDESISNSISEMAQKGWDDIIRSADKNSARKAVDTTPHVAEDQALTLQIADEFMG